MTEEKLYVRYDFHDDEILHIETLTDMKEWLVSFWNMNPDEDMSDEEHEHMIEQIWRSNEKELSERLLGIDYCFENYAENQ